MKQLIRILAVAALLALAGLLPAQEASSLRVIVNTANSTPSLSKARISRLFLKKTTLWDDGSKAVPVDLGERSPVRQAFSQQVLGKEVPWVKSYWQRQFFSGRATPPPELGSEDEILAFVRSNTGAIGYVSKNAKLGTGVKVLDVTE